MTIIQLDPTTVRDIQEEVMFARTKFPRGCDLALALLEEVQELFDELRRTKGTVDAPVRKEALQVACVALRLAEEGDPTFDAEVWTQLYIDRAIELGQHVRSHLYEKYPKAGGDTRT